MAEHSILQDATFWTAVAFVIFVLLIILKARPAVKDAVMGRIDAIRAELDACEALKNQAEATLGEIKSQQRAALKQAEDIVEHAKSEVKNLKASAKNKLSESLKRREAQAMDKIAQAEAQVIAEIRGLAVDQAIAASSNILISQMSGKDGNKLIDAAITNLGAKLN